MTETSSTTNIGSKAPVGRTTGSKATGGKATAARPDSNGTIGGKPTGGRKTGGTKAGGTKPTRGRSAPRKQSATKAPDRRRLELGRKGEELACSLLAQGDAEIIERNWKCPAGEADIIAYEDGDLVFIEVKTRRNSNAGFPEEAVTARKRARYEKIALHYLADHSLPSTRVRFDVIAVTLLDESRALVKHHRDAFCTGV